MESAWSNLFKWAANAEAMRRLAVDQQNVNCEAVAITLKTLYLSNLTDMFGEIPCSEAFRGSGENLTKPRFDTQRAVYEQLLADLEYANSIYDTSVAMSSAQRDLLYGGDMMKWRKFNNSLYLRLLMRLSNRDREMGIAARVRAVFEDSAEWPVFTSNDDNATFYYDEVNPFVNYFGNILESAFTTTGRRPAEQIIGMMDAPGDPRISIWFKQASGYDGWKGAESGKEAQESDNSGVSLLNNHVMGHWGEVPVSAPGWVCEEIVRHHLECPSLLCILSFQDWLSIDEEIRYPDVNTERINVPANPRHYWKYRMHLTLEELIKNKKFNEKLVEMIDTTGRF